MCCGSAKLRKLLGHTKYNNNANANNLRRVQTGVPRLVKVSQSVMCVCDGVCMRIYILFRVLIELPSVVML